MNDIKFVPRRILTGHKVNDCNDLLTIVVMDDPGSGGACHLYEVRGFDAAKNPSDLSSARNVAPADRCTLLFQNGPIGEVGVNGITEEALLTILIDRFTAFQAGPQDSPEGAIALQHLASARAALAAGALVLADVRNVYRDALCGEAARMGRNAAKAAVNAKDDKP